MWGVGVYHVNKLPFLKSSTNWWIDFKDAKSNFITFILPRTPVSVCISLVTSSPLVTSRQARITLAPIARILRHIKTHKTKLNCRVIKLLKTTENGVMHSIIITLWKVYPARGLYLFLLSEYYFFAIKCIIKPKH